MVVECKKCGAAGDLDKPEFVRPGEKLCCPECGEPIRRASSRRATTKEATDGAVANVRHRNPKLADHDAAHGGDPSRVRAERPPAVGPGPVQMPDVPAAAEDMSLRDYFAAAALTGVFAGKHPRDGARQIANMAYQVADAMLAERASGERDLYT